MKSSEIRKQLKRHFSFWGRANIIITDPEYNNLCSEDLENGIIDIVTKGDCDDYIRKMWCHLRNLYPQRPIGLCLLSKVSAIKTNHALVVGVCNDGIYLIDPQVIFDIGISGMDKIWKASTKEDRFYFVYI